MVSKKIGPVKALFVILVGLLLTGQTLAAQVATPVVSETPQPTVQPTQLATPDASPSVEPTMGISPLAAEASLVITDGTPTNPSQYQDTIFYFVTVSNVGDEPMENVDISHSNEGIYNQNFSCFPAVPLAVLNPGESISCTYTAAVVREDVERGFHELTVTVTSDNTAPESATITHPVAPFAAGRYLVDVTTADQGPAGVPAGTRVCIKPYGDSGTFDCRVWTGTTITFDEFMSDAPLAFGALLYVEPPVGSSYNSVLTGLPVTQGADYPVTVVLPLVIPGNSAMDKTVDKPEIQSGETITYTLSGTVPGASLGNTFFLLEDMFPIGFNFSSVTCEGDFTPVMVNGECFTPLDLSGDGVYDYIRVEGEVTGTGETAAFTITVTGTMVGNPGDSQTNLACVWGAGTPACDIVDVFFIQAPTPTATATPTETPTVTPPTVTPSVTPAPSVTPVVTPNETPAQTPTETSTVTPGETPTETQVVTPAPTSTMPMVPTSPADPSDPSSPVTSLPSTGAHRSNDGASIVAAAGIISTAAVAGALLLIRRERNTM